ncbi:Crp/Fnr family transcriptional regulator [Amycolatopsis anabasis]|uniref:Crp/Fnr family transcriptional regulator n=1 Tax=Amycolatopsis anabasis TaxID=1840409 RepID=UPI00131DA416|nr:cyclic nucleotide-binding domain-containing protein [Amycolatopsis anabasis]
MGRNPLWRDPLPDAGSATFWGSLDPVDRFALHAVGSVRFFPRRALLCRQTQRSAPVYLIYAGLVEVFRTGLDGERVVLARLAPGDIVGDRAAVDEGGAVATVEVVEPTKALEIPAEWFAGLCRHRPRIAWQVLANAVAH